MRIKEAHPLRDFFDQVKLAQKGILQQVGPLPGLDLGLSIAQAASAPVRDRGPRGHRGPGSQLTSTSMQSRPTVHRDLSNESLGDDSQKLWIDCDAGVDDAQGILLALAEPSVEVVALSAVNGNVGVRKVACNLTRLLTLCNRPDIPVYLGADEPLLGAAVDATHVSGQSTFHGSDGLGDVPDAVPSAASITLEPSEGFAPLKLVEAARASPGAIMLVAIGPLTNLALALKLEPGLPQLVRGLYVMGGAEHKGNVTTTAEYNFHVDPEAAHLVLKKFPMTVLVTWDCVVRHATPWPVVDNWLSKGTPKARFMNACMAASTAYMKSRRPEWGWVPCDPLAVALAIDASLIVESREYFCEVELHGSQTRGMSVVDWYGQEERAPNVTLVEFVNLAVFAEMMKRALGHGQGRASLDSLRRSSADAKARYHQTQNRRHQFPITGSAR